MARRACMCRVIMHISLSCIAFISQTREPELRRCCPGNFSEAEAEIVSQKKQVRLVTLEIASAPRFPFLKAYVSARQAALNFHDNREIYS